MVMFWVRAPAGGARFAPNDVAQVYGLSLIVRSCSARRPARSLSKVSVRQYQRYGADEQYDDAHEEFRRIALSIVIARRFPWPLHRLLALSLTPGSPPSVNSAPAAANGRSSLAGFSTKASAVFAPRRRSTFAHPIWRTGSGCDQPRSLRAAFASDVAGVSALVYCARSAVACNLIGAKSVQL
jgi:hypothetical protein